MVFDVSFAGNLRDKNRESRENCCRRFFDRRRQLASSGLSHLALVKKTENGIECDKFLNYDTNI